MMSSNNNMIISSSGQSKSRRRREFASSCQGRVENNDEPSSSTPYAPHPGRFRPTLSSSSSAQWEDFSDYSLSCCDDYDDDENGTLEEEDEDFFSQSLDSIFEENNNKDTTTDTEQQQPRRGSLLELILKEDTPTISGCDAPKMRRRGSMQERVIEDISMFQLLELQYGKGKKSPRELIGSSCLEIGDEKKDMLDISHRTQ